MSESYGSRLVWVIISYPLGCPRYYDDTRAGLTVSLMTLSPEGDCSVCLYLSPLRVCFVHSSLSSANIAETSHFLHSDDTIRYCSNNIHFLPSYCKFDFYTIGHACVPLNRVTLQVTQNECLQVSSNIAHDVAFTSVENWTVPSTAPALLKGVSPINPKGHQFTFSAPGVHPGAIHIPNAFFRVKSLFFYQNILLNIFNIL